jgi:hypothetical protein
MIEQMLDNRDYREATLECLRASAQAGGYENMEEPELRAVIENKVQALQSNNVVVDDALNAEISGADKHNIYSHLAAAAYIMAMRLDHIDKVYEKK